jgi:Tfp pilus assembly protein PilF
MLQQVLSISLLAAMAVPPASSQGIRAGSCVNCAAVIAIPATKVLVATPFPSVYPPSPTDSTNAVLLGNGLRDKLARAIDGGDWQVITRLQMNNSLVQWGYSADALLPPELARTVQNQLSARVLVSTALSKGADGRYVANTRFSGSNDGAGHVIKSTQAAGQQLNDMGSKLADQVTILFKAYADAKACNDNQTSNPSKAIESANKALKTVPGFGTAEFCLGEIAQAKDSSSGEALQHFKNAVTADPMSLQAVFQLATIDSRKHDSSAVVSDYQQMITIAPTNTKLANDAIRIFTAYGHPEAAAQVVDQQSKLDPTNPDWPDLQGNACAAQGANDTVPAQQQAKYKCAFDAFAHEYELDPERADTLFFQKIEFVAGTRQDSMTFAQRYVKKYPNNPDPLQLEMQLFAGAGQIDSAVRLANLLVRLDPTNTKPLLLVTLSLLNAHRDSAALAFVPQIKKSDDDTKNKYSGLLIQFADSASVRAADSTKHTASDDSTMVHLSQAVLDISPSNKQLVEYANYFIVLGLRPGLSVLSQQVRSDKSCDTVNKYVAFLDLLEPSVTAIAASSNQNIAAFGTAFVAPIQQERTQIPAMKSAFCKTP